MAKFLPLILFLSFGFGACKDNQESTTNEEITSESTFDEDSLLLASLYHNIVASSTQNDCIDSTLWLYTAIGSKACGGPTGYIAYRADLNADDFLNMVEFYTTQQSIFNKKWGLSSTCDIPPEPIGVSCNNGSPVLIYP